MYKTNAPAEEATGVGAMLPITAPSGVMSKSISNESVDRSFESFILGDEEEVPEEFAGNETKLEVDPDDVIPDEDPVGEMLTRAGITDVVGKAITESADTFVEDASDEEFFMEAADVDDDLKDTIKILNEKGYKTKYSCSGHPSARLKSDGLRDGIKYGKVYSTARIVFSEVYEFPNVPSGWKRKILNDEKDKQKTVTAIYVKSPVFNIMKGLPKEQFSKWKAKYMNSLRTWAKSLPNKKDVKETENKKVAMESVDDIVAAALEDAYVATMLDGLL